MKKYLFIIITFLFLVMFISNPSILVQASKDGIMLWFDQVLPALLPFTILSSWVIHSNVFQLVKKTDKPILDIEELFTLICGFIFGFPIGSKLAADFYSSGKINKQKAQILCNYANHLSPAFVFGYVCHLNLHNDELSYIIGTIIYLPSCLIALYLLIKIQRKNQFCTHKNTASSFQINMKIIDAGIINGFITLIKLCGYMMFFSIGIAYIKNIRFISNWLIIGITAFLEVTNGISIISTNIPNQSIKQLLIVASLSFGGVSGIVQTISMIRPAGLSIKKYIKAKIQITLVSILLYFLYLLFVQ